MTSKDLMFIAPRLPSAHKILAIGTGEPMDMIMPTISAPKCLLCLTKSPTFIYHLQISYVYCVMVASAPLYPDMQTVAVAILGDDSQITVGVSN